MNLTVGEAAERIGVTPLTLKRLEARAKIAPLRDLNNWRLYTPEMVRHLTSLYARRTTGEPIHQP